MIGHIIQKIRNKIHNIIMSYEKTMLLKCGKRVIIEENCIFQGANNISIGEDVYINVNAVFLSTDSTITIGNHVMFGANVCLITGDHRTDVVGRYMMDVSEKLPENDAPIIIEDDVWIGSNATILKGVTIGRGSVVGAGSVVTKSLEPYSVCVGNPARVIKKRFDGAKIQEHENMLEQSFVLL